MSYKSKNEEIYKELLERNEKDYSMFGADTLANFCIMKDRTLKQYARRIVNARDVIDLVAEFLQIKDKGLCLYEVYEDGTAVVLEELRKYIEKGGDKVKMKKRISELENENAVLKSLFTK